MLWQWFLMVHLFLFFSLLFLFRQKQWYALQKFCFQRSGESQFCMFSGHPVCVSWMFRLSFKQCNLDSAKKRVPLQILPNSEATFLIPLDICTAQCCCIQMSFALVIFVLMQTVTIVQKVIQQIHQSFLWPGWQSLVQWLVYWNKMDVHLAH